MVTVVWSLWPLQENQDVWGWELPTEDYETLSSMDLQLKYFDGAFVMNKDGPYRTFEDLWDEPKPKDQT